MAGVNHVSVGTTVDNEFCDLAVGGSVMEVVCKYWRLVVLIREGGVVSGRSR